MNKKNSINGAIATAGAGLDRQNKHVIAKSNHPAVFQPNAMSRDIFAAITKISIMIEANDGSVDDLFELIDSFNMGQSSAARYEQHGRALETLTETYGDRVKKARYLLARRTQQLEALPAQLRTESVIRMLLTLMIECAEHGRVSSKSICIASGQPLTTALRLLDKLEDEGLISRASSKRDRRVTNVSLTNAGQTLADKIVQA